MGTNKEFLSGTLSGLILGLLQHHGRMYGYEICQKAKALSNGEILLTEGAIYPALHRMEKKGLIISSKEKVNGRVRKYYNIQSAAESAAQEKVAALLEFAQHLTSILQPQKRN